MPGKGGPRQGAGRPSKGDRKLVRVWASVSPADHARIVAARVEEETQSQVVARLILAGLGGG